MSETTTDRLRQLISSGSVRSQADAARQLGVTRQRVSQIVAARHLNELRPTYWGSTENLGHLRHREATTPHHFCRVCGREYNSGPRSHDGICVRCKRGWAAT